MAEIKQCHCIDKERVHKAIIDHKAFIVERTIVTWQFASDIGADMGDGP